MGVLQFWFRLMGTTLWIISILSITNLTGGHSNLIENKLDMENYLRPLPKDLKPKVTLAFQAEQGKPLTREDCGEEAEDVPCPPSKYRSIDGECNNVRHPSWGTRGMPFLRMLKAEYADGKSQPRTSSLSTSEPLPNPLEVASTLQSIPSEVHDSVTSLLGAWSEVLLHDLAMTGNLKSEECCSDNSSHPECYAKLGNGQCKDYMRTLPSVDLDQCSFKYRNQMNLATSFLDGSAIYGNTVSNMESLRTFEGGLVNLSSCPNCQGNALYSAILREHNRIASNLGTLNKHWNDDVLFYESRRIVIAEIQHITYNEFLPTVLGQESTVNSELNLRPHGRFSEYSSSTRTGVYNEVALTALPALLSMLPNTLVNKTAETFAEMIDILITEHAQKPSMHLSAPLRKDWDTSSLFIHMSRDHGIPGYVKMVEFCRNSTFPKPPKFEELKSFGIRPEYIKALKYIYNRTENIDLLVGVLLETPLPGAIVGPTLNCLLTEQFTLLKKSDRFWYENDLPPSSLTTSQLSEIKKITLSGLLCANTDDLKEIQPKAFVIEDQYLNGRISCEQHALPNLVEWAEMDHMVDVSEELLMGALAKAEQRLLDRRKMEYHVWSTVGGVDPKSPHGIAAAFSKANKQALKLANTSLLLEFASNEILNSLSHRRRRRRQTLHGRSLPFNFNDDLTDSLQSVDLSAFISPDVFEDEKHCEEEGPCDPTTPYRTLSGHCNNLKRPNWGKSLTTFNRLLPSAYEDGISKPRETGVTGLPLPNARAISRTVHTDISNLHKRYTLMVMQFAQLVDHDLTMTPIHKGHHESVPSCRSCDSARTVHPECNPIHVPKGDHFYPAFNLTTGKDICFPFMRSLPGQLQLGPREQVNQNTAFLDGSMIYGENPCVLGTIIGQHGKMNWTDLPNTKGVLPRTHTHPECRSESGLCFIAGDGRASEQPGLSMIHTIYMREHNRIRDILNKINPHWNHEKMFNEVRRIVVAGVQHVTYNEFLPRILGWNAMNLYGLKLLPQGYYNEYNPNCNPSIFTEFATAAYRIGHSLLRPHIPTLDNNYNIVEPPILLRNFFFKTDFMMKPGVIDNMGRGIVSTPMESMDQFITGEVTNHLFEDRKIPFSGIDLIALNIQRARDHGVPSYNNYRALCNLKRASTWEDLSREIPQDTIQRLKSIYASVDDIDLFPGGMSERPLQGGLVGPTFGCIIAIQFRHLRKCDRFWYENGDPVTRFTEAQLAEIRKVTLAKVMCDNLDGNSDMQRSAFELPSNFLNPRVPCSHHPSMNFNVWRENAPGQGCFIGGKHIKIGESAFPSPCTSCVCSPEGGTCASLKITDCHQLLQEWNRDSILHDDVCTAQCGFIFRTSSRSVSSFASAKSGNFRQFQISDPSVFDFPKEVPDLSPFIV
ncbi:uncharacterized protein LOC126737238 [Anthonomus grandis grandis]|uniref:uncharacterized protein LOC126737238 n=1 Tax=Anthonomus grandis grandis TaxID=2921223 RepID=UPI002165BF53|nr:uncharacterized protein LOC126737238 [Anthonomus grandis grandis]